MAKAARASDFWATVVAEAQAGAESHAAIAAKHGVTEAAPKYHLYKARKPPAKRDYVYLADLWTAADVLRLLPTWVEDYNHVRPHKGLKMLSPVE